MSPGPGSTDVAAPAPDRRPGPASAWRAAAQGPRLLAFDTSTEVLAVALVVQQQVFVHEEPGGARASVRLLPVIRELLESAGLSVSDLDAIAFGRGPGAFTGLRTSCAVAQGLAFGAGCPVLPLDSLCLVAEDARPASGTPCEVRVATDARMDEIYAAAYRWDGERWHEQAAPALMDAPTWRARWGTPLHGLLAGSAVTLHDLAAVCPGAEVRAHEGSRSAALGRLARQAWRDGMAVDPARALPTYVRDKVAQTTAEREAARARPPEPGR